MKTITVACIVLMLWMGCDSDPSGGSGTSSVIMPLKIGNEWCYTAEWESLDKVVNNCVKLSSAEQIDSLTCYYDENQINMGYSARYYANRSDGLWLVVCGGIVPGCRKQLSIPYPATLGMALEPDTAISIRIDSSNGGWREYEDTVITALTLVSLDTLVEVPAGSFHCYKYEHVRLNASQSNPGAGKFYCYAVDKGLIYQENSYYDQGVKKYIYRSYLTSLNLE